MTATRQMHAGCKKLRTGWVGALLGVLLTGIVLAVDLPLVHDHDEAGLYNEECPLGRLAARAPRAPSPDAVPAPGPLPVCAAMSPTPWVEPALSPVVSSESRAPPPVV
jgi:hypothetical protein